MNLSSPWVSLGPLIVFNVILLCTVLLFRPVYRNSQRLKEVQGRHSSKFLNRWMREYWLWLTEPFVRFFVLLRLTPNLLTCMGVLLSLISGYFFGSGHLGLGGWLMIISATFDTFDGRVARATNRETKSGAYFDSVMDRISEGAAFLGMALYFRNHWTFWIVMMALLGSFMVSYTKARGDGDGARYSGGSMQRPERIVYLGVGAIFAPVFGWPLSFLTPHIVDYVYLLPLTFVALMTWVTAVERIRNVMRMLDQGSSPNS